MIPAAAAGLLLVGIIAANNPGDADLEVSAGGTGENEISEFVGDPEGDKNESAEPEPATTTTTSSAPASVDPTTTTERPVEAEEPSASSDPSEEDESLEEEPVTPSAPLETAAPTTVPPSTEAPTTLAPTTEQVTTVPPATEPPITAADCHPAYRPCIPNHPGDALNCGDLDSSQKPVTVINIGNDPYRLDSDNNGVGCQSG